MIVRDPTRTAEKTDAHPNPCGHLLRSGPNEHEPARSPSSGSQRSSGSALCAELAPNLPVAP